MTNFDDEYLRVLADDEVYSDCVSSPKGLLPRARSHVRSRLIRTLHTLQHLSACRLRKMRSPGFLRCLGAHYVFDDQREEFAQIIARLTNIGEFISTEDVVSMMKKDAPLDGNYFHLSFDDGLECTWRNGSETIDHYGIPAAFFINTSVVGSCTAERYRCWYSKTGYARPLKILDWHSLAEIVSMGCEVGAHTACHSRLSDISSDPLKLRTELFDCKVEIERNLGRPCRYLAWPYGGLQDIDSLSIKYAKSLGFEAIFSLIRGRADDAQASRYGVPRHHFEPHWDPLDVEFFARGGLEFSGRLKQLNESIGVQ